MKPFITFSSDFGTRDNYVASVKAVILSRLPDAILLDVTHEIPPFSPPFALPPLVDILGFCPPGAIHLVVVDPGVGTSRRPLLALSGRFFIVMPDNGLPFLLSGWIEHLHFVHLSRLEIFGGIASATFQARDLFAPAIVYLAQGKDPALLGPEIPVPSLVRPPFRKSSDRTILVWNVDRFGNLLLGYRATRPPESVEILLESHHVPLVSRYQEIPLGTLGSIFNSSGWLEIFCREGSASEVTGIRTGARIEVNIAGGEGKLLEGGLNALS